MTTPRPTPEGPRRTCVGCRRRTHPSELIRLVAGPDGAVVGRHLPGRGAWICPDPACIEVALTKGALARALRIERSAVDPTAVRAAVGDSSATD